MASGSRRGAKGVSKKEKRTAEYRFYGIPEGKAILALLGEKWEQTYGEGIDYLHFHNYMEIGYCYEGEGILTLGESYHPFTGGEFTVIPNNYLHTTNSKADSISRWEYLFIDVRGFLRRVYPEQGTEAVRLLHLIESKARFLRSDEYPELAAHIRGILDIMRHAAPFYEQEAEGRLLSLLACIARLNAEGAEARKTPEETERKTGGKINHIIASSLDYIRSHYSEEIKVNDIAQHLHTSEAHFRRVFTAYMDMSPLEYLNLVRIQSACEHLKQSDEAVSVIAAKCGFPTSSTFNRNFKRVTGVSPAVWRKRPENYERQILQYDIHSKEGW